MPNPIITLIGLGATAGVAEETVKIYKKIKEKHKKEKENSNNE